jgi:hypothetical protein
MEPEEGQLEFQEQPVSEEAPPAEEEAAASEEVEEAAGPEAAEETEPPKKSAQDRINELTGKWRSTERDRDDWRDAYFKLQQQTEVKREPEKPPPLPDPDMSDFPKPKWENFETEEDFRAAEIEWQAERVYRKKELQRQQIYIQDQQRQEKAIFEGWLKDGGTKYEDFQAVAMKPYEQGGPAITLEMDQAIRSDDLGHEIAYYLGQHPDESKRIAGLPPINQIREIGKLSAKLENQESKPKPKTTSAAPASTKGTSSGSETPAKDVSKMSFKEYEAMRNRQMYGDNYGRR